MQLGIPNIALIDSQMGCLAISHKCYRLRPFRQRLLTTVRDYPRRPVQAAFFPRNAVMMRCASLLALISDRPVWKLLPILLRSQPQGEYDGGQGLAGSCRWRGPAALGASHGAQRHRAGFRGKNQTFSGKRVEKQIPRFHGWRGGDSHFAKQHGDRVDAEFVFRIGLG